MERLASSAEIYGSFSWLLQQQLEMLAFKGGFLAWILLISTNFLANTLTIVVDPLKERLKY